MSKQIVALPVHLGENVCPVFDKACFYNVAEGLVLLSSSWNGLGI